MWRKLADFCTDGASTILGSRSGQAAHCVIYRQKLAIKTFSKEFVHTLQQAVKMVNTIKIRT